MTNEQTISNSNLADWIRCIKSQIRSVQIKAAVAVNEEMLRLYWNIGKDICKNQLDANYGS